MIVKGDNIKCFLVEESTTGDPAAPTAAGTIVLREKPEFPSQPTSYTEAKELAGTRSITDVMRDLRDAGSIKIPVYLRPSGAAGTPPGEGALLEGLLGQKTVTPATSVVYTPAVAKKSYTLWFPLNGGATVLFATGLAITEGEFSQEGKAGQPIADFSGTFLRAGWCGSDTLDEPLLGGETAIVAADSALFAVGAFINIGDSTNGGAGHKVTAINSALHTLTVDPAVVGAQDIGDAITPAIPAASNVGAPMPYRPAVSIRNVLKNWKSWKVKITDPVTVLAGEVSSDPTLADFPVDFVAEAGRKVEATLSAFFRSEELGELFVEDTDAVFEVDFTGTAPAGSRVFISLPQGRLTVPELALGEGAVERTITFHGKATGAGEDEIAITYT